MKIKKNDKTITIRCNSVMKDLADVKLATKGLTLSDYFREQLEKASKMKVN